MVKYYNSRNDFMAGTVEEQEWANLLAEIFDKLTQKHAAITYEFDNLEMAGKVTKDKQVVPTGTVSLTGKLTITAKEK
ncbi:MAG: hypothetical protein EA437_01305 [Candidatus Nitrosomarinus sp.]|nr:MAG: hypothetical protein EA437_01305 [Candidatus Nitrosomarinus sp.]